MLLLWWQCDCVRTELRELQNLFETSQKERAELELELLHCREELEKLSEERQVGLSLAKPLRFLQKFTNEAIRYSFSASVQHIYKKWLYSLTSAP